MLELGLSRISKLVNASSLPWRAIHVAGTNGKGSVCAYASSMLKAAGVSHGQFTSPHLIDRWDCIALNGKSIDYGSFKAIENSIRHKSRAQSIQATEFEELTAIAFEAFAVNRVTVGVVEVGLGGRLDATNVLENPVSTVITKIGLDHQSLLGNTVEEIAFQKAGILKPGVPCFVDGLNVPSVQAVISEYANQIGAGPITLVNPDKDIYDKRLWNVLSRANLAPHQRMNIALSFEAVKASIAQADIVFRPDQLASAAGETYWPGRLQTLSIEGLTSRKESVLLDGAHNSQAAVSLGCYVDTNLRHSPEPVTWLIGVTQGKDLGAMLPNMLRKGDNLITVAFGPVDGMPWIQPMQAQKLREEAEGMMQLNSARAENDVASALHSAVDMSRGRPLVIGGSLYLVGDVLRLLRANLKDHVV